ncbi:protein lap1 [Tribolium castaneum]|uniref:Protein lap1-like Protein n=1 Tax=Tribolium castaneum TaxID=7070 RepID=D6W6L1_TRICA|nr:PREDICTED: protein lap1 [Tribolium castaneum]EFA10854.1 Protein lap1-like Protein [Tribolium castaneum]|eukprot:XP_971940.1 PREDICTED: protein lap1 [Tribolium castaneum]
MSFFLCYKCSTNQEKIVELDYSRCGISEVPVDVYNNSPTLEVLHLEGNKLKDLSPQLFQCIDLRYLNVSDNEIRSIPPLISKLNSLQVLIFSKNALVLEGVSPNIDKLNKLTILDLSMNDLGKVPEAIMSLINLQQLCLNDTGIDYVPANIGRLSNLRILELRDNSLRELPKSIRRLTNLQRLDVSDNNLSQLTEVCESHGNLTELWINGNNITKLSPSITHLKKMNDFDASYNNLQTIPKEIGQWTKITNLILSFNQISVLPKAIGNLRNLQVLKLESNNLEELPNTISKLTNLEELNLQNNFIIKLPSGIGHLRKLATLILSDNKLEQLPPEIGSCCSLTILNVHNNYLHRLPDEVGHLQKLTTLGLIGNKLEYLPITVSKLTNLKALWLTPNQTQPLIHLQNEQLPDGQVVLTSVLFPQVPLPEAPPPVHLPISTQSYHITFNMDNIPTEASLSRTPTPHHKELRRLRNILRGGEAPESQPPNISEIKEAKVTHISGDLSVSQSSLLDKEPENSETAVVYKAAKEEELPKQPPPYHIAAAYSKNAHLFAQICPPSPHDQPKQFSQQQPANIHHPTPKLAKNREQMQEFYDEGKKPKWPFGAHQICKVIEVELVGYRVLGDFHVVANADGVYVDEVHPAGVAYQKLFPGDKILSFDDVDFTVMDSQSAYEYAYQKIGTVKVVTVSRKQVS